jgi:hypothetical protein
MTYARCVVGLLVLALCSAALTSAQQVPTAPIDLKRWIVTPADLTAVGWDGLELVAERALTVEELADRAGWPAGAGDELDGVRDVLLTAGWRQGYAAFFAPTWNPDRPDLGRQVEVEVVVYADAAGAEMGFALVPDVYPTGPIESISGTRRIGDESRLTRVAARDPQAGVPSQELSLGFRNGRFTARILLRDWSGAEPDVAVVEALAMRLLERIEQTQGFRPDTGRPTSDSRLPTPDPVGTNASATTAPASPASRAG